MTNVNSRLNQEVAFGNLAAAGFSVMAIALAARMPWFVGVPAFTAGTIGAAGVVAKHSRYRLTAGDYFESLSEFAAVTEDSLTPAINWVIGSTEPVRTYAVSKMPPVAKALMDAAAAERDDSWLTSKMIRASKFVYGARGTGKSIWTRYEARRYMAENPGAIVRVIDLHRNEEDGEWLPGLPESDYLATTKAEAIAFFRELAQIGRDRIASRSTKHPEYKLIVDEFQGVLQRFSDEERVEALEAIQLCMDELRKYRVNITLTAKSIKEKMTGIDSSILAQMDWLTLGNSLADSTNRLPLDFEPKPLLQRLHVVKALPGCKYACIYRPLNELAEVKVIPDDLDKRAAAFTFTYTDELSEEERWLQENREALIEMIGQGMSKTAIAKTFEDFGRRDDSNPKWQALTQVMEETSNV